MSDDIQPRFMVGDRVVTYSGRRGTICCDVGHQSETITVLIDAKHRATMAVPEQYYFARELTHENEEAALMREVALRAQEQGDG